MARAFAKNEGARTTDTDASPPSPPPQAADRPLPGTARAAGAIRSVNRAFGAPRRPLAAQSPHANSLLVAARRRRGVGVLAARQPHVARLRRRLRRGAAAGLSRRAGLRRTADRSA